MVSQTPETSEGLEVKPLKKKESEESRKELEERIRNLVADIGDAYASLLTVALELSHMITLLSDVEEDLQLYLKPEDLTDIKERIKELENNLKDISASLVWIGRKLVVKDE
jgi:archaellum component FlaC